MPDAGGAGVRVRHPRHAGEAGGGGGKAEKQRRRRGRGGGEEEAEGQRGGEKETAAGATEQHQHPQEVQKCMYEYMCRSRSYFISVSKVL